MLAQSTMKRLIRTKVLFRKQPLFNKPRRNNNAVAVVPCFFLYRSQKVVRSSRYCQNIQNLPTVRIGVCSAAVLRRRPAQLCFVRARKFSNIPSGIFICVVWIWKDCLSFNPLLSLCKIHSSASRPSTSSRVTRTCGLRATPARSTVVAWYFILLAHNSAHK